MESAGVMRFLNSVCYANLDMMIAIASRGARGYNDDCFELELGRPRRHVTPNLGALPSIVATARLDWPERFDAAFPDRDTIAVQVHSRTAVCGNDLTAVAQPDVWLVALHFGM